MAQDANIDTLAVGAAHGDKPHLATSERLAGAWQHVSAVVRLCATVMGAAKDAAGGPAEPAHSAEPGGWVLRSLLCGERAGPAHRPAAGACARPGAAVIAAGSSAALATSRPIHSEAGGLRA